MNRATQGMKTVADLHEQLADLIELGEGDRYVILAKDEEGNGFCAYDGFELGKFVVEHRREGDYAPDSYIEEERELLLREAEETGKDWEDLVFDADYGNYMHADAISVVSLWP